MSVAITYSPIKPPPERAHEIFGINVAIGDWLKAYFRYARTEKFIFLIGHEQELAEVREMAAALGIDEGRIEPLDRRFPEQNLAAISTVFRPEPGTRNLLWQRQLTQGFAFCGLAHAICGAEAGEVLQEYCLTPSEATDAIICPSQAVKNAVRRFWDCYGDYLQTRFGATYRCPVQLPVIPLGIDIEKFTRRAAPDKRAAQRRQLGVAEEEIVILWVGRLSAAVKAHPLAMFRAAELAAAQTGMRVRLVMVGYFIPTEAEAQFKALAAALCEKVIVTFIAANDPRFPDGLWAAGDIFLSLIDNMQESFGLTPIEAMAAGLPRVISDWDGYRDCVSDGEDGFLIRTMQPPPGNGFDLTAQVLNGREFFGGFLAKTALTVAVDVEQAGDRLARLMRDKNLRASMADKARARVKAVYDWRHIIPVYEDLWRDLAARRAAAPPVKPVWHAAQPSLPDPYTMHEGYPTAWLREDDRLCLALPLERIAPLLNHDINMTAHDVLITPDAITALLVFLSRTREPTIATVFAAFPALDKPRLWRTVAWLQKLGIVKNSG
jgi:glycosyltransferase involved in cell wall biosynthesis